MDLRGAFAAVAGAARAEREREERDDCVRSIWYDCACGAKPVLETCDDGRKMVHCTNCWNPEYGPDGPRASHHMRATGATWREACEAWDDMREDAQ